jgi:hypothetical protein
MGVFAWGCGGVYVDIMRTLTLLAAALALALVMAAGKVTASGTCFATIASGAGAAALTVCLSDHGNIVQWTTPAGVEHSIRNDGYVLCSLGELKVPVVHGWDAGISTEDGFGPPIIDQPNGANTLPLVITRTTDDGVFRLDQSFARDATEKDLTITMTVTNLSRTTRNVVRLGRYFGMSPNRQFNSPNNASTTSDSVFLWDDPHQGFVDSAVYGVMLTALTFGTPHTPAVEDHDDWNPQDSDGPQRAESCTPIDFGGPRIDLLDLRGRVTYELGSITPQRSRRVRFLYRHM